MARPEILSVIIAGGQGRRFSGQGEAVNKALVDLAGAPLIARVMDRLKANQTQVIISANADIAAFEGLGLPVLSDRDFAGAGPLAGVYAAMQYAARQPQGFDGLFTVPADTPFLPHDLLARLLASAVTPDGLAPRFAATQERWHPLTGLWPLSLAPRLRDYLASGQRAVHGWAKVVQAEPVRFTAPDVGPDPFFNINTPEDLDRAAQWLKTYDKSAS